MRSLYELYLDSGSVIAVKDQADARGLRTRSRKSSDGRITGGGPFGRSHIHHILTNPLYAGRIRHGALVHPGQHPAIIPPERWEEVQRRLAEAAPTPQRGTRRPAPLSPLAGKLYDETGDRLTPSHSRKNGHRLRYYISNRLLNGKSAAHPEAWRLPAPELERGIAGPIAHWLAASGLLPAIVSDLAAPEASGLAAAARALAQQLEGPDHGAQIRDLVAEVRIAPGLMQLTLCPGALAARLGLTADRIVADALHIAAPFRLRRRGVEARLMLGTRPAEVDTTLIRNIVKAQDWFEALTRGDTYAGIAARDGTWPQRIQQLIGLAFLAPDIVQEIAEGRQPPALTTEWLLANPLPADWGQQRARLAAL